MSRTSASHPIRVDFARPRLGMTFAPGKHAVSYVSDEDWARDLGADLDRLRAEFAVDLLVSLIEAHELNSLKIPELVSEAEARGIAVLRHPIRDGSVPALDGARAVVAEALAAWERGQTVVFHCRGGLGRAGTLCACTLRALGVDGEAAIAEIRAARPGAIENPTQEQFVRDFVLGENA